MCEEIKRIRINKLSSENNVFNEIVFRDGINLILGEKYDESSTKGRKTNGVGKSLCIEFLDFCFLCDYDKSRISKIPENVLNYDEYIILDLEIGKDKVTIKRNRREQEKPIIIRNDKETQFDKLGDAKDYITEILFESLNGKEIPSFRALLSLLIRDERSQFADILKCHDLSKRIPDDLSTHLFMLGMSLETYKQVNDTIKKIDKNSTALKKAKDELTQKGTKKIPDVKAEMNALESELEQLEEAMNVYRTNDAFKTMEKDILELENMLDQLRLKQKILKREYDKIKSLPKPEQVDDSEIELVYNSFKNNLGDAVIKSLNEVVAFKNKVEDFQRVLINQKARELEKNIADVSEQIRFLDEQYAEKIKIMDTKGILKNLKTSIKIYESKREISSRSHFLFEEYEKCEKQNKQLKLKKSQQLLAIDEEIESLESQLKSFISTLLDIHEAVMGNKECSFEIKTNSRKKAPVDISLRIYDDGSHSVDRTKVFIYDMALLFNEYTRKKHPLFLVHDNIFDVDQDTLVQCLNYAYTQEEYYSDFQYILTLNRDKIENEERQKLIKMDIDEHEVVVFTKKCKFLRKDYQENSK